MLGSLVVFLRLCLCLTDAPKAALSTKHGASSTRQAPRTQERACVCALALTGSVVAVLRCCAAVLARNSHSEENCVLSASQTNTHLCPISSNRRASFPDKR